MERLVKLCPLFLVLVFIPLSSVYGQNYKDALTKSILYFEGQRSGRLPTDQRVTFRGDSALNDGKDLGVDLVGGYYDAGDNIKFGLPMAFTITMLSWGVSVYSKQLQASGELDNALKAIRWGTDYLIKAHPQANVLYAQVGEGAADHNCWERPEDMDTIRTSYKIDEANPGSELAGETSAAFAAASIAFNSTDPVYAKKLRTHVNQLYHFAVNFRKSYVDSVADARAFYNSYSGYNDELLWAAAWGYKASRDQTYLEFLLDSDGSLGGQSTSVKMINWDNKYVGVQTLVAMILNEGDGGKYSADLEGYRKKAEEFMCSMVGQATNNVPKTPAMLVHIQPTQNLQFVTTAALVATVYGDHLTAFKWKLVCDLGDTPAHWLNTFAKLQVDYILGKNPRKISYMVGYSNNFPRHIHHRGASIVSIKKDPTFVPCSVGFDKYFHSTASDPNVHNGAIVGGPDENDQYTDRRDNYDQAEPCTYTTAPLVGLLARLAKGA